MFDRNRPVYHFSPQNWMNDPIPFFTNGEYHIFFQYNPHGSFWGTMHWGHAISKDLIHWEELPVALTPSPDGIDKEGCFTGCIIKNNYKYYLFYTGVSQLNPLHHHQCLANSSDLISWEKYQNNPLNIKKHAGYGDCFRDPFVSIYALI